jgi:hypothetical protein
MRCFDKIKNIQRVNILSEGRNFLKKNRIDESISNEEELKNVIRQNLRTIDFTSPETNKKYSYKVINVGASGFDQSGKFIIDLTVDTGNSTEDVRIIVEDNIENTWLYNSKGGVITTNISMNQKSWLFALKDQYQKSQIPNN